MISNYTGRELESTKDIPKTFKFYMEICDVDDRRCFDYFIDHVTKYLYGRDHDLVIRWDLLPEARYVGFTVMRSIINGGSTSEYPLNFANPSDILLELHSYMTAVSSNISFMEEPDNAVVVKSVETDTKKKWMDELEKIDLTDEKWKAVYEFFTKIVKS